MVKQLIKKPGFCFEAIQDNFKQGITSSQFLKKPSAIETEKAIEMVAKHKSESMQKMISSYQKSNDLGSQKEIASQPLPHQKSKMNDLEFNI